MGTPARWATWSGRQGDAKAIVREFPDVHEFRVTAFKDGPMDGLRLEVEDELNQPERIADRLAQRLGFRVEVTCAAPESLPRFDTKAKRFMDEQ